MQIRGRMVGRSVAAAMATVLSLGLMPAPAGATSFGGDQYWQHIGYSFAPCVAIEIRPNLTAAREPAAMRALAADAVKAWNTAIGKNVLRLGADTSSSAQVRNDRVNVMEIITSSNSGFGGVGGPTSGSSGGKVRIVEADVRIFDFDGLAFDQQVRDILLLTMIHEIGHGLGFLHTVDPDSPMSYVSDPGPTMDVDTALIARHLLAAPCGSYPEATSGHDLFADFARAKRVDFPHISRTIQPLLPAGISDTVAAGVALAHQRIDLAPAVRRAVVCRDDVFADCLAASALAGADGLLVFVPGGPSGTVPAGVRSVLARAFPGDRSGVPVYVVGGKSAVSTTVEQQLAADGYAVQRVADTGANGDRYGTAVAIAREVVTREGGSGSVLLARGDNPADAMTAGVVAARDALPVVLTPPGALSSKTRDFLAGLRPSRVVILGGTGAISAAVEAEVKSLTPTVSRSKGAERSATSVAIARDLAGYTSIGQTLRPITLLNGHHAQAWALALAFAPLGAVTNSPILLTQPDGYLPATASAPGSAPGSGRFLAELDLAPSHDGRQYSDPGAFFQLLGTEAGGFTPIQALKYADQLLLYCRWYFDDCAQEGVT